MPEILKELPKLSVKERDLLLMRFGEIGAGESPGLITAIDEAEASPSRMI